jgi:IS1 family transposase
LISNNILAPKVWTAVDRNRMCIAGFEVGDGSIKILEKLWNRINRKVSIVMYRWKSYI